MKFEILEKSKKSKARAGKLVLPHGEIETPAFFPVGTQGTVKTLMPKDLDSVSAEGIICNTYHLYLRPGPDLIKKAGGLNKFIGWNKPIITDSGGFQVFSIKDLKKVSDNGVIFKSHIDGSKHNFTPEKVIEIQEAFESDIMMPLDECVAYPCDHKKTLKAVERTTDWAKRSKKIAKNTLFGIVQGGMYKDLRGKSAAEIKELGFPGYAIGGLSVGEPQNIMFDILDYTVPLLEEEKPKHLFGVGFAGDVIGAVKRGMDTFDCVIPTRLARHGSFLTMDGHACVKNAKYTSDFKPIDPDCDCYACKNFSAAYLRHLIMAKEILGFVLITMHNIRFMLRLMENLRKEIKEGLI